MRSKISGGMEQGIVISAKSLVRDRVSSRFEGGGRTSGEGRKQILHIGVSEGNLLGNAHLKKARLVLREHGNLFQRGSEVETVL